MFFWPRDLDLWPMTMTYKLDLNILPLDHHAKNQVCLSVRSPTKVVTDSHTHTQCQNYYTRHATDAGCNNDLFQYVPWISWRNPSFITVIMYLGVAKAMLLLTYERVSTTFWTICIWAQENCYTDISMGRTLFSMQTMLKKICAVYSHISSI